MSTAPWSRAGRFADAVQRKGAPVLLRRTTRTPGPAPLINPARVTGASLAGPVALGSTACALSATSAAGRLLPGDSLLAGGVRLFVSAATAANPITAPGFNVVPIQPAPAAIAAGVLVLLAYAADLPTYAVIGSFPVNMIDGERITTRDVSLTIGAADLPEEIPPDWSVVLRGRELSIVNAVPRFAQNELIGWTIQARG